MIQLIMKEHGIATGLATVFVAEDIINFILSIEDFGDD